jgi:hypothetical protein
VKSFRDGVCGLGSFSFCQEQIEMRRLQNAGFDKEKLFKLAHDAESPAVREEAQQKFDEIETDIRATKPSRTT